MAKFLLTLNAGSSSIKFATFKATPTSGLTEDVTGQISGISQSPHFKAVNAQGEILADAPVSGEVRDHQRCLDVIRTWLNGHTGDKDSLIAAGHRVVHGGLKYANPVKVNKTVLTDLQALIPLAPLHQPHNLMAIQAFQEMLPDLPQVACFDTAFHRTQPDIAQKFGLPRRFFNEGVRRYGFHGLSYEYVAAKFAELDSSLADARVIVAHLGNGASLCAINKGQSIATTMGFSPLDGLLMGTRCGNLDPGVVLYLLEHYRLSPEAIAHLLYHESGLLGVSGIASDMRQLLASGQKYAEEAIALFVYRIVREIGSLACALGGLDALVFTGGIGEHSSEIRAKVCRQIAWLGVALDGETGRSDDRKISSENSAVSVWVFNTNENLMIAKHMCRLLGFC